MQAHSLELAGGAGKLCSCLLAYVLIRLSCAIESCCIPSVMIETTHISSAEQIFASIAFNIRPVLKAAFLGCRLDAIVYSSAVLHETFPFVYHLPGWVATLALVLMNLMSRDDLAAAGDTYGGDDGSAVSASGRGRQEGHIASSLDSLICFVLFYHQHPNGMVWQLVLVVLSHLHLQLCAASRHGQGAGYSCHT